MWVCKTNVEWEIAIPSSTGGRGYVVRFGKLSVDDMQAQGSQYGYTCTCPGFKFRGSCRHVSKANALQCGWIGDEEANSCPKCGEKITLIDEE